MRWILIVLTLLVSGPSWAQVEQPSGTIAVEDNATQDAAVAQRLRDILAELDGFDDITVSVSSGIVTLRGTTLSEADISRLTEIAARVQGVVAIENDATATTDVTRLVDPIRDRLNDRLAQLAALTPLLVIAGIVFVVAWAFGWLVSRARLWDRAAPNAFIADIYRICLLYTSPSPRDA